MDAYILLDKEILAITGVPAVATDTNKWLDKQYKEVIFKNCVQYTNCISKIDNAQRMLNNRMIKMLKFFLCNSWNVFNKSYYANCFI